MKKPIVIEMVNYEFHITEIISKKIHKKLYSKEIACCKTAYTILAHSTVIAHPIFDDEPHVKVTLIKEACRTDEEIIGHLIHEFSETDLVLALEQIIGGDFRASVTHYATVYGLDEPEAYLMLPF